MIEFVSDPRVWIIVLGIGVGALIVLTMLGLAYSVRRLLAYFAPENFKRLLKKYEGFLERDEFSLYYNEHSYNLFVVDFKKRFNGALMVYMKRPFSFQTEFQIYKIYYNGFWMSREVMSMREEIAMDLYLKKHVAKLVVQRVKTLNEEHSRPDTMKQALEDRIDFFKKLEQF